MNAPTSPARRTHPTYEPPVPRAGLLHAVGSSRRCWVVIALESGELSIPERPHVCLRIDKRAAGGSNRGLGVHQGYHLVVLGDELSWLEPDRGRSEGVPARDRDAVA